MSPTSDSLQTHTSFLQNPIPDLIQPHSSSALFHQQDANACAHRFCFKKSYSFALSCPQFPLENGKIHFSYEGGVFAKINLGGISGSSASSLPVTQGQLTPFPYLGIGWRESVAFTAVKCIWQYLSLYSRACCRRLQKADALSFCFPDLRCPGG